MVTATWCKAVSPSTLAVSMSAPLLSSLSTSSKSPEAQAARKTQPAENLTLRRSRFGTVDSAFVFDSSHSLSCSARLNSAELDRFSRDISERVTSTLNVRTQHTIDEIQLQSHDCSCSLCATLGYGYALRLLGCWLLARTRTGDNLVQQFS
jgi:hypothetical protein